MHTPVSQKYFHESWNDSIYSCEAAYYHLKDLLYRHANFTKGGERNITVIYISPWLIFSFVWSEIALCN